MLKQYLKASTALADFKDRLGPDDSGAALVEYSLLIGFITVAAVASILLIGPWVTLQWETLTGALGLGGGGEG